MKVHNPIILALTLLLASCGGQLNPPYVYNTNPKYTWGYTEFYGNYYSNFGNKNNVISLSLFTDSLKANILGELTGVGQYLFLEDVFVSKTDTLLPTGTYTISNSGQPLTVAPGKNDTIDNAVYHLGAFISYFEGNTAMSTIKLITDGSFTVNRVGNSYSLAFDLKTADKKALKGSFSAPLPHFNEALVNPKAAIRRRLLHTIR
jgi:hypothetical protein